MIDRKLLRTHIIILLFMFGFQFLPPIGQITHFGMSLLGIFIGALYGWLTVGFNFTCVAGLIAFGMTGAYESFNATLAATFGSSTAVMMVACLFICAFIEVIALTDVIIGYLLNLSFVKKNTDIFMFIFFFTTYLVSVVSNANLSAYIFVEMYRTLARETGIPAKSRLSSYMLLGITFASIIGEISLPFKPVAVLIIGLCQSTAGMTLSFGEYLMFLTSFQIIMLILFVLIGHYILRLDFTQITKVEVKKIAPSKKQKVGLWFVMILIGAFILASTSFPVFSMLGLGGVSLLVLLLMMFVQVEGEPLINLNELAAHFSWGMYLLIVFLIPFSGFVGSADAGIAATVKEFMAPVLTALPPYIFIVLALFFTMVFTNFLNNMPVAVIFISIMGTIQTSLAGINFAASCLAIAMCAFISMATPAANSAAVYVYGNKDLISAKETMLMGAAICFLLCIVTIIFYYPVLAHFIV